jgi:hypothetical protein
MTLKTSPQESMTAIKFGSVLTAELAATTADIITGFGTVALAANVTVMGAGVGITAYHLLQRHRAAPETS